MRPDGSRNGTGKIKVEGFDEDTPTGQILREAVLPQLDRQARRWKLYLGIALAVSAIGTGVLKVVLAPLEGRVSAVERAHREDQQQRVDDEKKLDRDMEKVTGYLLDIEKQLGALSGRHGQQ